MLCLDFSSSGLSHFLMLDLFFSHFFTGNINDFTSWSFSIGVGWGLQEWNGVNFIIFFSSFNDLVYIIKSLLEISFGFLNLKERFVFFFVFLFRHFGSNFFFVLEITFFEVFSANLNEFITEFKHFKELMSSERRTFKFSIESNSVTGFNSKAVLSFLALFFYTFN